MGALLRTAAIDGLYPSIALVCFVAGFVGLVWSVLAQDKAEFERAARAALEEDNYVA